MIVDSSAIFALVRLEPECDWISDRLTGAESKLISAATWVEVQAVGTRRFGGTLDAAVAAVRERFAMRVAPVTPEQADIARAAYRRFGMGTGHPARLNFGDCFAYALSRATGEPLLFVGDDFSRTDVAKAL